jgi:hypothetical protein
VPVDDRATAQDKASLSSAWLVAGTASPVEGIQNPLRQVRCREHRVVADATSQYPEEIVGKSVDLLIPLLLPGLEYSFVAGQSSGTPGGEATDYVGGPMNSQS